MPAILTFMRTTIELTAGQRAQLIRLSAERGLKGFSDLVREAIDAYLEAQGHRDDRVATAVATLGALSNADADELERSVARGRETWRAGDGS